jgi:hypothetical protein
MGRLETKTASSIRESAEKKDNQSHTSTPTRKNPRPNFRFVRMLFLIIVGVSMDFRKNISSFVVFRGLMPLNLAEFHRTFWFAIDASL